MKTWISALVLLLWTPFLWSQAKFTHADSLRGTLYPLRAAFDVTWYDLDLKVDPLTKRIAGTNRIYWRAVSSFQEIQLELHHNLEIVRFDYEGKSLPVHRNGDFFYVSLPKSIPKGATGKWEVLYGGTPLESPRLPWTGGFSWKEDSNHVPLIAVACEGDGANLWWPLKDHLSDEPDSMRMRITVPAALTAVSNGRLRKEEVLPGGFKAFTWAVTYPINSYNVTLYIGDYVHISDTYKDQSGTHDLSYYVLRDHEAVATRHFKQVAPMMDCFEKRFGPYPFWNDSYKLVETSYWGMEHQSAVAYGNEFKNNEFGFDFIIVHESAHEWFGNSISVADHADMWIHESFATYAETILLECWKDEKTAQTYLNGQRNLIGNKQPMVGPYGVNYSGWEDNDIYFKGAWMLHSIRKSLQDDDKWNEVMRKFCAEFRLKTVNTNQVIAFFNKNLERNYTAIFDQYLRYPELPELEIQATEKRHRTTLHYRWKASEPEFNLPVFVRSGGTIIRLDPSSDWQHTTLDSKTGDWKLITDWGLYNIAK